MSDETEELFGEKEEVKTNVVNFADRKYAIDSAAQASIAERKEFEISTLSTDTASDRELAKMNATHAFIQSYGGKPAVMCEVYDPIIECKKYEFRAPESIMMQYCNQSIMVGDKWMELGKWWLKHAERREYQCIIFDPDKPTEKDTLYFNTYRGLSVRAIPGTWHKLKKHIYTILCNSDPIKFTYVIKWFAWALQNPGRPAETALVFKGKQGSGKGMVLNQFVKIFGEHGMTISNPKHLTGQYNSHLARTVFLFADEAYNPGDREVEGVLKNLITEPRLAIEQKFRDAIIGKNCLHIVMASNDEWVVPVTADSRRFFVNETDNRYAKSSCEEDVRKKYFDTIHKEIKNGGTEAMVWDLLNMDLGDWHPRWNVPDTEELQKQKIIGMTQADKAYFYMISDGIFPGIKDEYGQYCVSQKVLHEYLSEVYPELKHVKGLAFKTTLEKYGLTMKRDKTKALNTYVFPELSELRRRWKKSGLPGIFEEPDYWRMRTSDSY